MCSHVFVFSTLQEIPLKIYYDDICLPWALAFFYESASFASPIVKHIGQYEWIMHALIYVFWGPHTPWALWHFLHGVNQSGPGTSSTTNHIFYKALGQLHGLWYKQFLTRVYQNCRTNQIWYLVGMWEQVNLPILELLCERLSFYTVLILGQFYLNMEGSCTTYKHPYSSLILALKVVKSLYEIPEWYQTKTILVRHW